METRASHVLIGAFTLTIIVLAVVSILWLGKLSLDREWAWYDVIFTEAVTGLTTGGAVQYSGIQIGEVRRLSLAVDDPRKVVARIRVSAGTPVKVDTRAQLAFTGLTGVSIIQLSGGTPGAQPLRPARDAEVGVIVADTSALQSLMVSGEGVVTGANELILRMSVLLQEENIKAISGTLANLDAISGRFAARGGDIDDLLDALAATVSSFNAAVERADGVLATIDASAGQVRTLVDQDGARITSQLVRTLTSVQQASDRLGALVEENSSAITAFSRQGLVELAPAVADLRAALQPVRQLARRLEAEPGLVLQPASSPREVAPP